MDPRTTDTPMEECQPPPYWLRSSTTLEASHQESSFDGALGISRGPGAPTGPPSCTDPPPTPVFSPQLPPTTTPTLQAQSPHWTTNPYTIKGYIYSQFSVFEHSLPEWRHFGLVNKYNSTLIFQVAAEKTANHITELLFAAVSRRHRPCENVTQQYAPVLSRTFIAFLYMSVPFVMSALVPPALIISLAIFKYK